MKLNEIWGGQPDLDYLGFSLEQVEEREDDNSKIWHTVTLPNGQKETLDHSPYEYVDPETFRWYVMFYKQHKRFPNRQDINSIGPLSCEDIHKL